MMDAVLQARLKRRRAKYADLAREPLTADLPGGGMASWVVVDAEKPAFERLTSIRKAVQPLLAENPAALTVQLPGTSPQRHALAEAVAYTILLNAAELPSRRRKQIKPRLTTLALYGCPEDVDFANVRAMAEGNTLARSLTMLPPNELTPALYRERIKVLAAEHGWAHEEFDLKKLRKLGAGAFVAVAQGSADEDAAIVHLTHAPSKAKHRVALVGKGICFDTGGHNLKPARYMHGMHEDMNGSAVALGILLAASEARLPLRIDCWLAVAQNHIGPKAYKQNDVVTALNGTTIEIVHTDAEGRMVLADTLTLASRGKPDLMVDFATLTGSMMTALGNRMSGVIGNRPELLCKAVEAGRQSGERVWGFPFEADYDEDLDSKIADIKQCTLESEADHILAARFLSKFIEHDVPWLHVDLSSSNRKGGLGAVAGDVTGFGVSWGFHMLQRLLQPEVN
jgi:leucyl aminopeptidase